MRHDWGFRATVGAPIRVEGRLSGILTVVSTRDEQLPSDTEARLAGLTELVGTAIANAQARADLRSYADEQAALRRVATLVARAAPPDEVFAAVALELGAVFAVDFTGMTRTTRTPPPRRSACGAGRTAWPMAIGDRLSLGGRRDHAGARDRPARADRRLPAVLGPRSPRPDRTGDSGVAIGVPIKVGGRLWGVAILASARKVLCRH